MRGMTDGADQMDDERLRTALTGDPRYQVRTVDGLGWLCPFTATVIPAPLDWRAHALAHLSAVRPWEFAPLRDIDDLVHVRWLHHLRSHVAHDDRFRTFRDDGAWLNPYDGSWHAGVRLVAGRVGEQSLDDMASILARCPSAREGRPLGMLEFADIVRHTRSEPEEPNTGVHRALDESLDRARRVLERMLPALPALPGMHFDVVYEPHLSVGGDFYDVQPLARGRLLLAVGDIAGHGPEGALLVVSALKALRFAARRGMGIVDIVCELNRELRVDLEVQQFLTLFAAEYDPAARALTCVCAGHHQALLVNPARTPPVRQLGRYGAAIGLMQGEQFRGSLQPETVQLEPGDVVLQFTDGLFEVRNRREDEFGYGRVILACAAELDQPGIAIARRVVDHVRRFAGGSFTDDVTLLGFEITG